jgi:hypothetical protein
MPYVAAEASKAVTVEKLDLTLTADKRWEKAGGVVTFTARLTKDGAGYSGQSLYLEYYTATGWYTLTSPMPATDANGYTSSTITLGYDRACEDVRWRVRYTDSAGNNYYSPEVKVAVAYPTRISLTAPDSTPPGVAFTVSGKLEYEKTAGNWVGLAVAPVKIYADSTLVASPTTDANGNYSASITLTTSQTIKAVFEGMYIPSALIFFAPSELSLQTQAQLTDLLTLVGAFAPIIAVGGVVAYQALAKG